MLLTLIGDSIRAKWIACLTLPSTSYHYKQTILKETMSLVNSYVLVCTMTNLANNPLKSDLKRSLYIYNEFFIQYY